MPGVGGSLGQGGTLTTPLLLPLALPPLLLPVLPLPVLLPLPPVELPDDGEPPSSPGSTRPPQAIETSATDASRPQAERCTLHHGRGAADPLVRR